MIRSLLYVPASSDRFIAKAHERGADAIILDLEDSVAPSEKDAARAGLAESVRATARNGAKVFVRINAGQSSAFADADAACRAGAFGLFVPKAADAAGLQRLAEHLTGVEHAIGRQTTTVLVPMIEDPGAVLDARSLAAATPRVFGLLLGSEDLATVMDAVPTPEVLRLPKLLVHLAAKAAGVLSFGLLRSVSDYRNLEEITRTAQEARAFGFDGATCVHPSAVAILNQAFTPSPQEIDRATRMIAAYAQSLAAGRGACVFEGKMIDLPMVTRAKTLVAKGTA